MSLKTFDSICSEVIHHVVKNGGRACWITSYLRNSQNCRETCLLTCALGLGFLAIGNGTLTFSIVAVGETSVRIVSSAIICK